jgi:pimeloyl-ACP methyl ester carboxylesterase
MHSTVTNRKTLNIAFYSTPPSFPNRNNPGVIFLPGFKSDMTGGKAIFLEEKCKEAGIAYARFDYSGHGESQGNFARLTLSDWLEDCELIIDQVLKRPVYVVGSSMGGWLGLRLAEKHPDKIKGFVGIAPAPDFTTEVRAAMTDDQKFQMSQKGHFEVPSDYDEPYIFSKMLLDDGKDHCMLDRDINFAGPVHILQGKQDSAVPWEKALKIKECLKPTQAEVTLIEDGDHSLSRPEDLEKLWAALSGMIAA